MDRQYVLNSYLPIFSPVVGFMKAGIFDFDAWREWCRASAHAGANGIRILPYAPWRKDGGPIPAEYLFCPYTLNDNGKWNLDIWNDEYFAVLRQVIQIAKEYNLTIWFSLFDNCQFHRGCSVMVPWSNNIHGTKGYLNDLPRSLTWVRKAVSVLGTKVFYEIGNELTPRDGMSVGATAEWAIAMFFELKALGVPEKNICWGAILAANYKDGIWEDDRPRNLQTQILTKLKDDEEKVEAFRAMHGVGVAYEDKDGQIFPASYCGEWALQWWGGAHSGRGFLSDDGVRNGASETDKTEFYRRPSPEQWHRVALRIFERDGGKKFRWVIERLPEVFDIPIAIPALKAIAKAHRDRYGEPLTNEGKFPPADPVEPPVDPPVPPPEPPPAPAKPWWKRITWQGWVAIMVIVVALMVVIF